MAAIVGFFDVKPATRKTLTIGMSSSSSPRAHKGSPQSFTWGASKKATVIQPSASRAARE